MTTLIRGERLWRLLHVMWNALHGVEIKEDRPRKGGA